MNRREIDAEIAGLKNLLGQTDYEFIKSFEALVACDSATKLVAALKAIAAEFGDLVKRRQGYRDRINELEAIEPEPEEHPYAE